MANGDGGGEVGCTRVTIRGYKQTWPDGRTVEVERFDVTAPPLSGASSTTAALPTLHTTSTAGRVGSWRDWIPMLPHLVNAATKVIEWWSKSGGPTGTCG